MCDKRAAPSEPRQLALRVISVGIPLACGTSDSEPWRRRRPFGTPEGVSRPTPGPRSIATVDYILIPSKRCVVDISKPLRFRFSSILFSPASILNFC